MRQVDDLLERINSFVAASELLLRQAASGIALEKGLVPEHLLLQAMERAKDDEGNPSPQRGKEAYLQLIDLVTKLQREKTYFDAIPMHSKWTIDFPKAHLKAIVEKIVEAGHPVLILKTFLQPHMVETGSQGSLVNFLKSIKSEKEIGDLREKIKDARKIIKTLDRLLTKKFPISAEDVRKSPIEVQKMLAGIFSASKGRPLTEDFVRNYKVGLESNLQKWMAQLPPRPESMPESE